MKSITEHSTLKEMLKELEPENHIYVFAEDTLTNRIIEKTSMIGVAKLKLALREIGYDENEILVVYGPGSSVTNSLRERVAGFEDGIRLLTRYCRIPYIKPGCGYYVGHIPPDFRIDMKKLRDKYKNLNKMGFLVDGYKVFPWTDKQHRNSNHFLEIWELEYGPYEPGLYLAIHTEFDQNKRMWSECKEELAHKVETPLGCVELLEGSDITKFQEVVEGIDELSKKKRATLASLLIDEIEEEFNENHKRYFMDGMWCGVNASNYFSVNDNIPNIVPITFDENSPIYLAKGRRNIERCLWPLGYEEKAEEIGLAHLIERINIIPHGGSETKDDFNFKNAELDPFGQLVLSNGESKMVKDPSTELGRRFRRPEEVLPSITNFKLGEIVGKLNMIASLGVRLYEE